MADAEAGGQEAGGGKKKLILFVVVVLLAVGASIGGTMYFMAAPTEPEAATPAGPEKPAQAVYHNLRPAFVVNYMLAAKPRYLQLDLTVMSRDAGAIEAVINHTPLIRSRILGYLTDYDFLSLQTQEGKTALSDGLRALINTELRSAAGLEGEPIESMLFNNFVLQ